MEDKWSIKKVLESQGDVHKKVANQSNSELPSSSPTRSPRPPRIQIDVQIAYNLHFGCSTYARKSKKITFPKQYRFLELFLVLCHYFGHDPRPFIFSSRCHFTWVFLRLICQEQFYRHLVCKTPTFVS
jgi:hypothetical protein